MMTSEQEQKEEPKKKNKKEEQEAARRQRVEQLNQNWYTIAYRRKLIIDKIRELHSDVQNLMKVEQSDPEAASIGKAARLSLHKELRFEYNKSSGYQAHNEKRATEALWIFDDEVEREEAEKRRRRLASKK